MSEQGESMLTRLRFQAEQALERSDRPSTVVALLDRILEIADDGSEPAIFAHRHLAELRLEKHPWRAALHLRKVMVADPHDDVTHALMGLCQALLGNYRAAIGAYQRALRTAPATPWYHHNLGHLLDVAIGEPERAEPHLRKAYQLEPHHDEIIASLAHCLARLGGLEEAEGLASAAVRLSPKNRDHANLLRWIKEGAEKGADVPSPAARTRGGKAGGGGGRKRVRSSTLDAYDEEDHLHEAPLEDIEDEADDLARAAAEEVREHFEGGMGRAGFTEPQRACARRLWSDFSAGRRLRVTKPAIYAAAVEYAIATLHGREGSTQAAVAKRYGVATTSLASRYREIRETLELRPADPRYRIGI